MLVTRVTALLICLLLAQKAWAGVWLYQGERALERKYYSLAYAYLEKAQRADPSNEKIRYLLGRASYDQSRRTRDLVWLQSSLRHWTAFTEALPYYGRGWLYLALTRLSGEKQSQDGLTSEEWAKIKPLLEKAYQQEPGSAWVAYMTGTSFLSNEPFLTREERQEALLRIQKSVTLRRSAPSLSYLDEPSTLLKPALKFLWMRYSDPQYLKDVTPFDYPSYRVLIKFLSEQGLWSARQELFPRYLSLEEEVYQRECQKGEDLLARSDSRNAFFAFRKAFWIRGGAYHRAKAGILVAQEAMNQLPTTDDGRHELFQEDFQKTVRKILEDEDQDIGMLLGAMKKIVRKIDDLYLSGLHAARSGEDTLAIELLEKTEHHTVSRRRYLARSYAKLLQPEKAAQVLRTSLEEEGPDLRDLILLASLESPWREIAQKKIVDAGTIIRPPTAWWGSGERRSLLDQKGRLTMGLNLWPGKVRLRVQIRSVAPGSQGYVRFFLQGILLAEAAVEQADRRPVMVETQTAGGKRWFEVELVNGQVELGSVEVLYETKVSNL